MSDTQTTMEPDAAMMRRHVGHLFDGWLDGCQDGKIELAWTDGRDGRLRHAAIFGTDQPDELVAKAVLENSKDGQNVYIGQALRKPGIAPFGRCKDEDFYVLTAFYADIDEDVVLAAAARNKTLGCIPTATVITGRHPHPRAQMLWRLNNPVRDADLCRRQNLAIAQALGGDTAVINPSRVLRLAGSIAWPRKEGRIAELTELLLPASGKPDEYLPEQVAKAFPPVAVALSASPQAGGTLGASYAGEAAPSTTRSATLQIGTSNLSVDACLARIRAGDHWHDNLVRLTGHWIARGWSDAEILTAAETLTLNGYTAAQTWREVAAMIAGGRRKWGRPDVTHLIGEAEPEQRPIIIDPRTWSGKPIPQRQWLVDDWIPMNHVTALYGDGGLGKTLLAQQLLTSVSTGRPWLGQSVRKLRAFGLLCEDHADDLHINQERINGAYWIDYTELGDLRLWPSVGFDNLLMTFDGQDSGKGLLTQFFGLLLSAVREFGARFVVLDTAADLFGGNENIRTQVRQFVANACGRIAREIEGAVLLCAHPSLSGMASGSGSSGSTAWNNTVRSRLYLTQADADEGEDADPDIRVLTRKKSNYARAGEMMTLRWTDGVIMPVTSEVGDSGPTTHSVVEMLKQIDERWTQKNPFSASPQSDRYVVPVMVQRFGLPTLRVTGEGCMSGEAIDTRTRSIRRGSGHGTSERWFG